jgi:hypothetical protein
MKRQIVFTFVLTACLICTAVTQEVVCHLDETSVQGAISEGVVFFSHGVPFFFARGKYVSVLVGEKEIGKYLVLDISVANRSDEPVTVRPEKVCTEDTVAFKVLSPIPPSEVAKQVRHQSLLSRFFAGAGMAMQQQAQEGTATSSASVDGDFTYRSVRGDSGFGSFSGTATTTTEVCDAGCQQRKREIAEQYSEAQRQREQAAQSLRDSALLSETLFPGKSTSGTVFFPLPKKGKLKAVSTQRSVYLARVILPIGQERFVIVLPLAGL